MDVRKYPSRYAEAYFRTLSGISDGAFFRYYLKVKSRYFCKKVYYPICSQCSLSLLPENIRKPYSFLMF